MTNIITQQTRARREFKALGRAEKANMTGVDVVNQMVKSMENPDSPATLIQAAGLVLYMQNVKNGETPIADAVDSLIQEKKANDKKAKSFEPSFQ